MRHSVWLIICYILASDSYSVLLGQLRVRRQEYANNMKIFASNDWHEIIVLQALENQRTRLDVQLLSQFPQYSRSYLSSLCSSGNVLVNGKPRDKNFKVKENDMIRVNFLEKEQSSVTAENIPLNVIYEDDDMIVVNKPVGMVVHPAPGSPNGTFVNALLHHIGPQAAKKFLDDTLIAQTHLNMTNKLASTYDEDKEIDEVEDNFSEIQDDGEVLDELLIPEYKSMRPGIVHRLDKGTSGVLMAGKHSDAVFKLSRMFSQHSVKKIYLVICVGHPGEEVTMASNIGRNPKNRQLMTTVEAPLGKLAISHIKTIAFDGKLSASLVRIETGRTHQIRVHMQSRRTPVVGDEDYGNKDWNKRVMSMLIDDKVLLKGSISRPLLHSYETEINHPYSGAKLLFRAPIPSDIAAILKRISPNSLVDERGFLTCSTKVIGHTYMHKKGFVPSERIKYEDKDDWLSIELPTDD